MKKLLVVVLVFCSFLCVSFANSQEKKETAANENVAASDSTVIDANGEFDDYNKVIDVFFEKLKEGDEAKAVDFIFSNSKWFSKDPDQTDNVKHELSKSIALIGRHYGQEKLVEKNLRDRLVIVTYLVRYERQPMQFTFKFYKPDNKWTVYSFSFNGSEPSGTMEVETNVELLKIIKDLQK